MDSTLKEQSKERPPLTKFKLRAKIININGGAFMLAGTVELKRLTIFDKVLCTHQQLFQMFLPEFGDRVRDGL